jgi:hypothetical protein
MDRLREKHLNVSLEAVLHPASKFAQEAASGAQAAATSAPSVREREPTAQKWFEEGLNAVGLDEQLR